jgi:hypothetical protein
MRRRGIGRPCGGIAVAAECLDPSDDRADAFVATGLPVRFRGWGRRARWRQDGDPFVGGLVDRPSAGLAGLRGRGGKRMIAIGLRQAEIVDPQPRQQRFHVRAQIAPVAQKSARLHGQRRDQIQPGLFGQARRSDRGQRHAWFLRGEARDQRGIGQAGLAQQRGAFVLVEQVGQRSRRSSAESCRFAPRASSRRSRSTSCRNCVRAAVGPAATVRSTVSRRSSTIIPAPIGPRGPENGQLQRQTLTNRGGSGSGIIDRVALWDDCDMKQ